MPNTPRITLRPFFCSACRVGELDEETLFYYASRGIDKKNAEDIMTKGRIEVIIRKINDEDTEKLAEEQLEEVLQ